MGKPYYLNLIPNKVPKPRKLIELTCERCGKKFMMPFWYLKKGRRFCSHACRKQDPLKTLLSRIVKQPNGCWLYTGNLDFGGYGQIKIGGITHNTHRIMWALWNKKPIPDGMVIRHTCIGNRNCINPDHLILGTPKENVHDTIRNGRFKTPFMHDFRHIDPEVVNEIRRLRKPAPWGTRMKPTYKDLARKFNTKPSVIWQIVNDKTYKDVKIPVDSEKEGGVVGK